jgi:hypothetical protein
MGKIAIVCNDREADLDVQVVLDPLDPFDVREHLIDRKPDQLTIHLAEPFRPLLKSNELSGAYWSKICRMAEQDEPFAFKNIWQFQYALRRLDLDLWKFIAQQWDSMFAFVHLSTCHFTHLQKRFSLSISTSATVISIIGRNKFSFKGELEQGVIKPMTYESESR